MDLVQKHIDTVKDNHSFTFDLKEEQIKVVNFVCNRKDVFVCLPTGYGKTMCMILPPLLLDKEYPSQQHCVLIVSPLKALMQDQYNFLLKHNISCIVLGEEAFKTEIKLSVKVMLSSPEAINDNRHKLQGEISKKISAVIYDECHCVCKWGNSFRPEYLKVGQIQSWFQCPVMALSATVTKVMKIEMFRLLGLSEECEVVSMLPDRPNIRLSIGQSSEHYENELHWIIDKVKQEGENLQKLIIFCHSIDLCQTIFNWMILQLKQNAFRNREISVDNRLIEMFHRGTDSETKDKIIENFKLSSSILKVVVCTIAFGIGIDIPNVHHAIVWGLPDSILDLWQLIGRCGRDGQDSLATCYAFPRSMVCKKCKRKSCSCTYSDQNLLHQALHEKKCLRRCVLEVFVLDDITEKQLPQLRNICESENCTIQCMCEACMCCISCAVLCTCGVKLKF